MARRRDVRGAGRRGRGTGDHGPRRARRAADDPPDGLAPLPPPAPHDYDGDELRRWLARLEPFLADGVDALVYFRHDDVGRGAELALELAALAAEAGLA